MISDSQRKYEERVRNAWLVDRAKPLPDGWLENLSILDEAAFQIALQQWTELNNPTPLTDYVSSKRSMTDEQRSVVAALITTMHARLNPPLRKRGRPVKSANRIPSPIARATAATRAALQHYGKLSREEKTTIIANIVDDVNRNLGSRVAVTDVEAALRKGNRSPLI